MNDWFGGTSSAIVTWLRPHDRHEGQRRSSKFILELMEPERPKVDCAVLDFVKEQVFDPTDFTIRAHGVCRLNPEMARMAVTKVST